MRIVNKIKVSLSTYLWCGEKNNLKNFRCFFQKLLKKRSESYEDIELFKLGLIQITLILHKKNIELLNETVIIGFLFRLTALMIGCY